MCCSTVRGNRLGRWGAAAAALAGLLACHPALAFVHIGGGVASKWGDTTAGTGAVVTWGFVPDGTTIDPGFRIDPFGSPDDVGAVGGSNLSQLRSLIDTNHGAGAFDAAIRRAFDTWSAVADINFVEVADPGTPIAAAGSVTPNIRISAFAPLAGHFFEGTGAVGFGPPGFIVNPELDFPESGDIFFNLNGNKFGGQQTPFQIAPGVEDVTPVDFYNFGDDLEGLFLHEVGHAAIGLDHPPWDGADPDRRVMYVGDYLNPSAPYCCTALNRGLDPDDIAGARFVYGLKGDNNADGRVDAADYSVWRDALGQTGASLAADSDRDGAVTAADYDAWRVNFGAAEVLSQTGVGAVGVPEPSAGAAMLAALLCCAVSVRRFGRRAPLGDDSAR
ncbi:hypothetical protein Pla175_51770 [Pirellulimonas nuda]|uniref:Dockerin domain-containing protein n=1 Tax=Pirellulimonas nuda TaxID=2528009 RepID=A0A518DJX1_9BACT|nr:hypothetical protein [Pirellulimonas nuda]QDU91746.1 hypothetical protein Pla175_51770 [Pirellulimonas nuda]